MTAKKKFSYFIIICCYLLTVPVFLAAPAAGALSSGSVAIIGTIHLVAYNLAVTGIDTSHATVSWKTNGDTNSTVEYGTTSIYGSVGFDMVMGTSHSITLNGLSSNTIYHYRVVSTNLAGESYVSSDSTFQTSASSGTVIASNSSSTTFPGTTIQTVGGIQQISLNVSTTHGTIQVSGNTITVQNPGNGWSRLQYVGSNVTTLDGNINTGPIQGVSMQSDPVTASLGGTIGTVSTQIEIGLTQVVSGVAIQQSIIQGASTAVANAFQVAATNNNLDVKAVAYTVEFQNTALLNANLNSDGVKLNLSIDHAWVVANAPDGSVNNVKILRFGDDGTKEVLSTTYLGSQGTTDFFAATSPHGLSIFGIVAVASSSTSSGGSSTSGGVSIGSNGGGGGGGTGSAQIAVQQGSVQNPGSPAVQQGQPQAGPPQNAFTTTQSLAVAGLHATTGPAGIQTFTFDTTLAAQSGVSVAIRNNAITINQPGLTLTIVTRGSPSVVNGIISGTVQSASITTTPSAADLSFGTVSVSIDALLATIPENAAITTSIYEEVSPDVRNAFQLAAHDTNQQVEAIAYVVIVEKINFVATGPATVTMTVPPGWVTSHGGMDSVSIVRMGDDQTVEMLDTSHAGMDAAGTRVFEGHSPHGLSVFGITTVKALEPARQEQPGTASITSLLTAAFGTVSAVAGGIAGLIMSNYVLILALAGLVIAAILVYTGWHKQSRGQKKRK